MKVVILAGGLGTRLSEETEKRPKPLVEVGGYPILWHVMKHYSHYGFNDFVIALGYKGEMIKKFFVDYLNFKCNLNVDFSSGNIGVLERSPEKWKVELIDTGLETLTGGRLKRLEQWLYDEPFMLTYGDGVSNIDLIELLDLHKSQNRIATITAVRPPARFGGLTLDGSSVTEFSEKPQIGEGWINGGFMVFEPAVMDCIEGDDTILEAHTLGRLARDKQLSAFRHEGFWQCIDTLRDLKLLNKIWSEGSPPWKTWD
jgi:glucose-1-phosphate cytidylyltransferase